MGDKTRRIAFYVQLVCSPLNFGSMEPGSGLPEREKKREEKGKKGEKIGERNEPWSQARNLVNFCPKYQIHEFSQG